MKRCLKYLPSFEEKYLIIDCESLVQERKKQCYCQQNAGQTELQSLSCGFCLHSVGFFQLSRIMPEFVGIKFVFAGKSGAFSPRETIRDAAIDGDRQFTESSFHRTLLALIALKTCYIRSPCIPTTLP